MSSCHANADAIIAEADNIYGNNADAGTDADADSDADAHCTLSQVSPTP